MKRSHSMSYRSLIEKTGLNQLTQRLLTSLCIMALFMDAKPLKGTLLTRAKILLIFSMTLTLLCLVIFISSKEWTKKEESDMQDLPFSKTSVSLSIKDSSCGISETKMIGIVRESLSSIHDRSLR